MFNNILMFCGIVMTGVGMYKSDLLVLALGVYLLVLVVAIHRNQGFPGTAAHHRAQLIERAADQQAKVSPPRTGGDGQSDQ